MTGTVSLKPDLGRYGVWLPSRPSPPSWRSRSRSSATAQSGSAGHRTPIWPTSTLPSRDRIAATGDRHRRTSGRRRPPGCRRVLSPHRKRLPGQVSARHRRRPSRAHRGIPQALRRAGRVPRRTRRGHGADQPAGRRGPRTEGAQARGRAQRGRTPVPDHAGAHRPARELIGPTVFLAPEHKVVLDHRPERPARSAAETVDFYLGLSNYLNSWKRLGFTDEDVRQARQRPADRRPGRIRHARRHRQASQRAPGGRRRPRHDPGAGRLATSCCRC